MLEQEVLELFVSGYAPSKIDDMLKLYKGASHSIIVRWWKQWKEDAAKEYAAARAAAFNGAA